VGHLVYTAAHSPPRTYKREVAGSTPAAPRLARSYVILSMWIYMMTWGNAIGSEAMF